METRVCRYRRTLHQIPELGRELPETLAFVRSVLEPLGCRLWEPAEGALCAFFDGGKEETVAFRADMDALPVEESRDCPFRSAHHGRMHACGHDGHTAMLLELAQRLKGHLGRLERNVLLIFQPAEETDGGAESICESGILERCRVSRIFGFHLWPGLPEGTVWTRPGPLMAKNSEVDVTITGRGAHITKYHEGVDALWAGGEFLRRVYAMAEGELPAEEPHLLRFGRMESGTVRNVVSDHTVMEGSLRVFSMETFHFLQRRIEEIGADLERETGCDFTLHLSRGFPPVRNDEGLVRALTEQLGEDAPGLLEHPELTAEDFSFYQTRVPGVFCFLGAGDVPPLHASDFHFDETVLEKGVAFYEKLLYLR